MRVKTAGLASLPEDQVGQGTGPGVWPAQSESSAVDQAARRAKEGRLVKPLRMEGVTALRICHWRADEMKQTLAWLGRETQRAGVED